MPLPRWGHFWIWGYLKPGFGWVIRFKLTSTLAPNVYNDCSIRGSGPFFMLSNVLDSKGEGVSPSHGGAFLDFGVLNPAF